MTSPVATLYLVRHGRASSGVESLDPGLDETGRAQAQAAAGALAHLEHPHLVVSPLRRTRETAEPIASKLAVTAGVRNEVAEVFDPRMPVDERRTMIGPFMAGRWSDQPAELKAWREAVITALHQIAGQAEHAIVVSHYVAIGVAIGAATGDDRVVPTPIANCSITRLVLRDGSLEAVDLASTAHLPPDLVTGATTAMAGQRPPAQR